MTSRYRWVTITVTSLCMVLAAFTVWFVFSAFADYRTPDFIQASKGKISGTCIQSITDEQLQMASYHKSDWSCDSKSKKDLSNLLAVSVHAMYAADMVTPFGTGTNEKAVFNAVVMATQGQNSGYSATRAAAYEALKAIGTPKYTDCSVLYPDATTVTTTVPLPPTVACDAQVPANNNVPTSYAINTDMLYTHCVQQFSYGRSNPTSGTFTIPKVGEIVEPVILPVIGTNSTTLWSDRARILVGTRLTRH